MEYMNDLAIIIVNRDRPDLTDKMVEFFNNLDTTTGKDVFVIEMGSRPDNLSKYCSYYYEDSQFNGKAYGHNQGLNYVLENYGRYRYYWFLMNDLVFTEDPNPVDTMIEVLSSEPRMGLLSPTENNSGYPESGPQSGSSWHKVSTTDYLALMMKDQCLQEVGFLGPHFKYSWGAIHELSFKMYRAEWFLAYCDKVVMKHLGGTTYGATENTISRMEYQKQAHIWCTKYFFDTYGENWDEMFTQFLPEDVKTNMYTISKKRWATKNLHILVDEFLKLAESVPPESQSRYVTYLLNNIDDCRLFLENADEMEIALKRRADRINIIEGELKEKIQMLKRRKKRIDLLTQKLSEQKQMLTRRQKRIDRLSKKVGEKEQMYIKKNDYSIPATSVLVEQIQSSRIQKETLVRLTKEAEDKNKIMKRRQERIDQLTKEVEEKKQVLKRRQERIDLLALEAEEKKQVLKRRQERIDQLTQEAEEKNQVLKRRQDWIDTLKLETEKKKEQLKRKQEKIDRLTAEVKELKKVVKGIENPKEKPKEKLKEKPKQKQPPQQEKEDSQ